jgi:glucose-6-phosphate-specific signal transduction histidine kinase
MGRISEVGPLDAVGHLVNLLLPALVLGAFAAALAKLVWRRELAGVAWRALALVSAGASACALLAGLVWFGRDGKMATYAAMVVACALALWWRGFMRRR